MKTVKTMMIVLLLLVISCAQKAPSNDTYTSTPADPATDQAVDALYFKTDTLHFEALFVDPNNFVRFGVVNEILEGYGNFGIAGYYKKIDSQKFYVELKGKIVFIDASKVLSRPGQPLRQQ